MALGVRVRFRSRDGSLQGERVLRQMPVRLGRNAMNDCALGHPFISDFHAVLDLVDDQLCVRDLNSRNGVYDRNMARLPAGRSIPLSALGHTFVVGRTVEVWVETFEESRDIGQRASSFHGAVLGNRAAMAGGWAGSGDAVGSALGNALPARAPGVGSQGIVPLPPLSIGERSSGERPPAYVAPAAGAPAAGNASLPGLSPLPGASAFGLPPLASPGNRPSPPPQRLGAAARADAGRSTQHLSMSAEILALLGLRELASSLVPGVPLETTGDVARLVTKLHDLVEVFCRCFVPLRDARLAPSRTARRGGASASALRTERAADPATLAASLLDWRNHDYDAPDVIESVLSDVVMQQAAMVDTVMHGVGCLLDEISPDTIERAVNQDAGMGAVFGRYRALWLAYRERFDHLADERRRIDAILGPDLASGYREHLARQGKAGP
jgi:type VI secretion system protein ImpI